MADVDFTRPTRAQRPTAPVRLKRPNYKGLHGYQRPAVDWMRALEAGLLADAMGLGKTAEALRAMTAKRNIVVCPASALGVWEAQTARWRPDFHIDPDQEGDLRVPRLGELVCCSWDRLPDPIYVRGKRLKRILLDPTDDVDVYFDEIQYAKTIGTDRQERAALLRAQCRRAFGLSGSPVDTPQHMWAILVTLDLATKLFPGGEDEFVALCGGKPRFVKRQGYDGQMRLEKIGYQWGEISDVVRQRVASVMLRRTPRDPEVAIDLPNVIDVDVLVRAPKDLRKFLDDEQREAWKGIDPNALPPFEKMSAARAALAKSRTAAAVEWTEQACLEYPVVVFCSHLEPLKAIAKMKLPHGWKVEALIGSTQVGKERTAVVERFQRGETRVLALSTAGAEAITLTEAGAMLLIDRTYLATRNNQIKARIVRQGQLRKGVIIATMRTNHPLDIRLQEILDEKERLAEAMGVGSEL